MGKALSVCIHSSGPRMMEGELRRVRQGWCSPRTKQRGYPPSASMNRLGRAEGPRSGFWLSQVLQM